MRLRHRHLNRERLKRDGPATGTIKCIRGRMSWNDRGGGSPPRARPTSPATTTCRVGPNHSKTRRESSGGGKRIVGRTIVTRRVENTANGIGLRHGLFASISATPRSKAWSSRVTSTRCRTSMPSTASASTCVFRSLVRRAHKKFVSSPTSTRRDRCRSLATTRKKEERARNRVPQHRERS